eukprot:CAMPEP_0183706612 /NCGR_PEP_ID=MMETSP0737-20130205/3379_1 /TAXON_ID=385413 /ORGANISM="Thalassiosira miniscula, Strain CCMP1093" /LENGTH=950 /DNA_ID=CAMNT_0025934059 /DNA_START=10 /DNA_END=2859 /DNA_ORIENTATION=+
MASSDPPETSGNSRSGGWSISSYVRGTHGDPPSSASVASSSTASTDTASNSSYGGHLTEAPRPDNIMGQSSHSYNDDLASQMTAASNAGPPSVLRNGNKGYMTTSEARQSRNQRIASARRMSNPRPGDVDSFGQRLVHSALNGGMELLSSRKKSGYAVAIFGLVGMLAVTFFPNHVGTMKPGGSVISRSLKDLNPTTTMMTRAEAAADAALASAAEGGDFLDDFDQRRRRAADLPDGTVFSEPAHTRMCRTIVERLDAYDAGVMNFEQVIFTESEYVCRDPDAPYTSVMNMFAAELLDTANNHLGLNVDYTHRCAKWERFCTGNMTTIQFGLPDPLSIQAYAFQPGCVDATALRTICSGCLASDDPTNPDCVLFPDGYLDADTNTCDLGCYFSQVLPWIRNNLRTVATNWLNTVETRALTFWLRNAAEFSHREKDDMEVSVIALSCANEDCDMSMGSCTCEFTPLANWVYAMHVPRSSTNVAITVSPTCAKFGEGCILHAQELYHFFKQLYPRADITYNIITSTSSWYMRMITADHLVCPPGVGCLLPAIARDAYTYVYETVTPTVGTWLTCTPQDYLTRLTIPSYPPEFAQGDCRHLRARLGAWTQDLALATDLQYTNPVDGYLGCADTNFVATAEDPYRPPTTYRWDETIWTTCPVEVLSKEEMCIQMERLNLKRILFVGDHTTMSQAISLASILGVNDNISLDPAVVPNFSKTVGCTGHSNFDLTYIRNDRLEEPGTTPSPGNPNCGPDGTHYCYPWSGQYSNYENQQLMIVNTGYHWGEDWEGYISNFQNFVGRIDEISAANAIRVNDVIMFRTSIPGHKECDLFDGVFRHYGEYCPRIVNGAFWHWWGELPPYNDYAIRIINEWNLLNTVKSGPNIELLDPWMMTVLRPDGHLSGSDAGPNCGMNPQECMLYSLPGPVDWWNHLLLMQLVDIGTHRENSTPMQAW